MAPWNWGSEAIKAWLHRKPAIWIGWCLARRLCLTSGPAVGTGGRAWEMKWELTLLSFSASRKSLQSPQPNCLKGELIWPPSYRSCFHGYISSLSLVIFKSIKGSKPHPCIIFCCSPTNSFCYSPSPIPPTHPPNQ